MSESIIAALAGIMGTFVGGLVTYFTQSAQFKYELKK